MLVTCSGHSPINPSAKMARTKHLLTLQLQFDLLRCARNEKNQARVVAPSTWYRRSAPDIQPGMVKASGGTRSFARVGSGVVTHH